MRIIKRSRHMSEENIGCPEALKKMRFYWVVAAIIKSFFCLISLQCLLGSSLGRFLTVGFVPPLLVMIAYLIYSKRRARQDQNLLRISGDSVYYLGFLFTVLSIVAAMADLGLSDMGAKGDGTMTYVASRFALAMLTTVLGMGYRAYIVTFALPELSQADSYANGYEAYAKDAHSSIQDEDSSASEENQGGDKEETTQENADGERAESGDMSYPRDSGAQPRPAFKPHDEYIINLVIKALSEEALFKQLQDSMNNAILNFNQLADNAYATRSKLEASLATMVERMGQHLQKATEEMTATALKGVAETVASANEMILDNLKKTNEDNQKALVQFRETNVQMSKEAAEQVLANAQNYQRSLDALLSEFTQAMTKNVQMSRELLDSMSVGVNQLSPKFESAIHTLTESAQRSHASLEKASVTQLQVLSDLNEQLVSSGRALNDNVQGITNRYGALESNFEGLAASLSRLNVDFAQLSKEVTGTHSLFGREIATLKQHSEDLVNIAQLLKLSGDSYNQLKNQLETVRAALTISGEQYEQLQKGFMENAQKTTVMVGQLSEISEQLNTNATRFNGGINYLNKELEKTSDALVIAADKYEKEKNRPFEHKRWWQFWK